MSSRGRDIHFDIAGRVVAAQEWGTVGGRPVMAIHGWLDNSASFQPLAAALEACEPIHLIALDTAGHGHSSHIADGLAYNIWGDISDIFAVADVLGWDQFSLLGHSRGAIISALAAGTFPERIGGLCMIDALAPPPLAAAEAPEQLAKSIADVARRQSRATKVFEDIAVAVKARQGGMHAISEAAARLIVERGIKPVAGGYTWSSDPRLMSASALKLTREQILAFIGRIQAPAQLIAAEQGLQQYMAKQTEVMEQFKQLQLSELDGGHFLHMENHVQTVAALVNKILP
ncbi:MAG: alpha/beta hydrolase [Cellvibrionaceae bacterium]|nr:alpha/beta hydrolase [Cellvibrionaceae bacterium]MCV6625198.1 alpha/beta hydrolase [Cellvibrionaceae bacterium]